MSFKYLFYPLLTLITISATLAESTSFTFDDADVAQQYASITWSPSTALDGASSGCKDNSKQSSCDGVWWTENGDSSDADSTAHTSIGPSTSVNFIFNGDSVTAYFVQSNVGAKATYSLDRGDAVPFTTYTSSATQYQQPLIQLSGLKAGTHSLLIAYDESSYDPSNPASLVIDKFSYTIPPSLMFNTTIPSTTAKPQSSTQASSQSSSPTAVAGNLSSNSSKHASAGIIAVAVLCSIAFIALVAVLFTWLRRRRPSSTVSRPLSIGSRLGSALTFVGQYGYKA